jgi:arginase
VKVTASTSCDRPSARPATSPRGQLALHEGEENDVVPRQQRHAGTDAAQLVDRPRQPEDVRHAHPVEGALDHDVLDFVDFPIADNAYQRNQGLSLDDALSSIAVFAESAQFAGLVLADVNPDHAPGAVVVREFASRLAAALVP